MEVVRKTNQPIINLKYIKEDPYWPFEQGKIYNGIRAKDDKNGLFWCFFFDENMDDDPGWYGFPASWFEVVEESV